MSKPNETSVSAISLSIVFDNVIVLKPAFATPLIAVFSSGHLPPLT
ncbi:MAG: hypothetical protein JXB48_20635 [Candidatus Latescibacteria bacterium]|nr:hypothetical protein [Candidatus Latescibacterota bacterium]